MLMIEKHHLIIIFNSLHRVMLAELRLQEHFSITLMPVPRALSADCGMVVRIEEGDCDAAVALLLKENIQPFVVYRLLGTDFVVVGEFS